MTQSIPGDNLVPEMSEASATHIVNLPEGFRAAGLRQAIRQANAQRVLLVAPPDGLGRTTASNSAAIWQIARRQADAMGVELALVTRNGQVRQLAIEAGLPVFGSVEGALSQVWHAAGSRLQYRPPAPARGREPISHRRRGRLPARFRLVQVVQGDRQGSPPLVEALMLLLLLLVCVAAVSAVLAFVVPVATVTLVPAQEPRAARVTITARPDAEELDAGSNLVLARRIGQRVEGEDSIEATGTRSAPDQPARGSVVFTNRQPTSLQIPADTIVATSTGTNVRFRTLGPAELPGGVGQGVTVPIEALEPGPAGNVRAFSINTIEGSLALSANVLNSTATGGGSVKQAAVVTQGDKDRLRSRLLQQVTQRAYLALGELLEEGEFVPPETVGTLVVAETYDRFTDEQADQVTLRLRLLVTGLAVDGNAADALALQALSDQLPRRGRFMADSVNYSRSAATVVDEGDTTVITFDVTASTVVVLDIDPAAVRGAIRGLPVPEAIDAVQQDWRLQSAPKIVLGPEWLLPILRRLDFAWLPVAVADRVPWLTFRTQVRVEFEG